MTLPMRQPSLFRLDSSLRSDGSVSRALADAVEEQWRRELPHADVVRRDLGANPLPAVWPAAAAGFTGAPGGADTDRAAALAAELVDELLAADVYVFAVPMYNFGVPQQVKHWIDLVICDPRAADVSVPLLPGRPAVLVEARGGGYGPGTPRDGWNHATPFLRTVLTDVWGLELEVVSAELTAADYNPAMANLRDLARQLRDEATSRAAKVAQGIAARLRSAA